MCFDGMATIQATQTPPSSTNQNVVSKIEVPHGLCYPTIIADNDSAFHLDSQSLDRLHRFHRITCLTMGSPKVAGIMQGITLQLVCTVCPAHSPLSPSPMLTFPFLSCGQHPYLMHMVQTITAAHDRYQFATPSPRQTVTEVYHLWQAAALFNRKLSRPIEPHERDGLWSAAAMLGTIALAWIDAATPDEAWPLRPADPSDLEWLRMSESKAAIWDLTDPLRPGGLFHALKDEYRRDYLAAPLPVAGICGIPEPFVRLCALDDRSTAQTSPYYASLRVLAPLLAVECTPATVVRFLGFISHMQPAFKRLLELKDPRALLLLAYWYAKVRGSVWWLEWRAVMECRATCLYLERFHSDETAVLELLLFPKIKCGLLTGQAICAFSG